ncbi:MAG: four helix bundle protein [Pseudomonadota bacterium]
MKEVEKMLQRGYKDLQVWQKSMDFVDAVYIATKSFPKDEVYGLTSQLRRSAVSVASNIAEGSSRGSTREFIRFIEISYGSLAEAETQIYIANRQKYIVDEITNKLLEQAGEIGRMLNGLSGSLNKKIETTLTDRRPLVAENY